jgi:hypothetical protein
MNTRYLLIDCLRCFQVGDFGVTEDFEVSEFAVKRRFYSSFGEEERHEERFQTWQAVLFHWSIQLFDGGFDGVRQTTVEIGFSLVAFCKRGS